MQPEDATTHRLKEKAAYLSVWAEDLRRAAAADPRYTAEVVEMEHRIAACERRIARRQRAAARRLWWGRLLYRLVLRLRRYR